MDLRATAKLSVPPKSVFDEVADLATYPEWMGLVHRAEDAEAHDGDPGPAWFVDLGIAIGPIKRTKTVRMVRVDHEAPHRARFERLEHDGKEHPAWVLAADVATENDGSSLTMHLHYGGNLNFPGVEALLREEVRRAGGRLEQRLAGGGG